MNPGGVRVGTPALTSRGLDEADFEHRVADFLDRGTKIAAKAQQIALLELEEQQQQTEASQSPRKKVLLKDFCRILESNAEIKENIASLRQEVEEFASKFPMPGSD